MSVSGIEINIGDAVYSSGLQGTSNTNIAVDKIITVGTRIMQKGEENKASGEDSAISTSAPFPHTIEIGELRSETRELTLPAFSRAVFFPPGYHVGQGHRHLSSVAPTRAVVLVQFHGVRAPRQRLSYWVQIPTIFYDGSYSCIVFLRNGRNCWSLMY